MLRSRVHGCHFLNGKLKLLATRLENKWRLLALRQSSPFNRHLAFDFRRSLDLSIIVKDAYWSFGLGRQLNSEKLALRKEKVESFCLSASIGQFLGPAAFKFRLARCRAILTFATFLFFISKLNCSLDGLPSVVSVLALDSLLLSGSFLHDLVRHFNGFLNSCAAILLVLAFRGTYLAHSILLGLVTQLLGRGHACPPILLVLALGGPLFTKSFALGSIGGLFGRGNTNTTILLVLAFSGTCFARSFLFGNP
mmetsp:Transcript_17410/g.35144  ORF Transcript_17410/g.35144 Transcript_17410/m.35144 type:complete len:252 (-) Transcript_17410:231-986(-)